MTATSVVVLSWNGESYLSDCLSSVMSQSLLPTEVILVDNASLDNSVDLTRSRFPTVRVIQNARNLGVAAGMNIGLEAAHGDLVVLLNQDTVVDEDWLGALLSGMSGDRKVAIAGCKILRPDGKTLHHAGATLTYPLALSIHVGHWELDEGQYDSIAEVDYVTGAALGIWKEAVYDIGWFDEGFFPAYFEDVDLCFRARYAGYKVVFVPQAKVMHHEATSVGLGSYRHHYYVHKNRVRFVLKHYAAQQIHDDFVPAEEHRLGGGLPWIETHALRRAYLDNLLALPSLVHGVDPAFEAGEGKRPGVALHLRPEESLDVGAALCSLREQALKEESATDE